MEEYCEIDAIKAINEAMLRLTSEEQARVLSWAYAKFSPSGPILQHGKFAEAIGKAVTGEENGKTSGSRGKTKKGKFTPKMIKDLDLHPAGKPSAVNFAQEKKPNNAMQKSVVAVYYIKEILEVGRVSIEHVYTYFKAVGWPVPADVANTLRKAGTEGWLDTADGQDILITTTGDNLIEHQLPAKLSGK